MKKSSLYLFIAFLLMIIIITSRSSMGLLIILSFVALIMLLLSQQERRKEKSDNKPNDNIYKKTEKNQEALTQVENRNNHITIQQKNTSQVSNNSIHRSSSSFDEQFIKYIMSENHAVRREEAESLLSVFYVYSNTKNKQKALEAFDEFIRPIATSNDSLHASMVCGFFCGLLGGEISLTNAETTSLSNKYGDIIKQKIIENGGIFANTN